MAAHWSRNMYVVHAYVCACDFMEGIHTSASVCGGWSSWVTLHLIFWGNVFHWAWNSPIKLAWLTNELQRSTCLCTNHSPKHYYCKYVASSDLVVSPPPPWVSEPRSWWIAHTYKLGLNMYFWQGHCYNQDRWDCEPHISLPHSCSVPGKVAFSLASFLSALPVAFFMKHWIALRNNVDRVFCPTAPPPNNHTET